MNMRPPMLEAQMLDLSYLLGRIAEGSIAVPDFQREFVWSDVQVKSLLGTALNGWPAGSLLLMRSGKQIFQLRPLEGAPPIGKVDYLVLDGQQRLTALYHALLNTGPSVYAIDLSDLQGNDSAYFDQSNLEERITSFKREDWDRNYQSLTRQRSRLLLPIHALQSAASFFEWRDAVTGSADALFDIDFEYRELLTKLYRDYLSAIHRYSLPAVVLESGFDVAAIARIFEKVNRTGTLLNAFDLMVARVYEPGWNLREPWEASRLEDPLLDYFLGSDGMPVLQAIALRTQRDVGQRAVLDLPPSLVHHEWDNSISGVRKAIDFCFSEFGVRSGEWMPYGVMLVALSALAAEDDFLVRNAQLVRSWFWSRGFGQAFDAAANTRIVADYGRLVTAARERLVDIASTYPVREDALLGATRRGQRAVWAMFMCALAKNQAVDPATMVRVDDDVPGVVNLSKRPREGRMIVSLLERDYHELDDLHLRVLGLVQLSRSSSKILRSTGLTGLLDMALRSHDEDKVDQALASQFLPPSRELLAGMSGLDLLDERLRRLMVFLSGQDVVVGPGSRFSEPDS
jgi:hypothetical protein